MRLAGRWLVVAAIAALVAVNVLPLLWGLLTSLKSEADLFRFPPTLVDFQPTLENYRRVAASGFGTNLLNSFLYAALGAVLALAVSLPAAYAFERTEFPLRRALFVLVIASIPLSLGAATLLVPNYLYFASLGLNNRWFTLPLIYAGYHVPVSIWILRGAVEAIPRELDEAVRIDGGGWPQIICHVILPLSRPALAAAGVLVFVGGWNEFVAGSVLVDDPALKPIQPAIYGFIGFFGRDWGPLTASATLSIIPIVVIFAFMSRQIVSGLTQGSVKG